jgi:hypothetical protein
MCRPSYLSQMLPELNANNIVEAAKGGNDHNDPPLLGNAFENFLKFKDDWSQLRVDQSPAPMDELNALVYHYVAECYGRTEIKRWLKVNKGRSVLDKITASDLAFSILVYNNYSSRWTSEIWTKATQSSIEEDEEEQECHDDEDAGEEEQEQSGPSRKKRKKASNMPLPFSKPKTKKLKYLEIGWTSDGVQHYKELENSMKRLMRNETLWNELKQGWENFISGLHEDNHVTCWIPQFRRMDSLDDDMLEEEEEDGFDFELPTPALGTILVPQVLGLGVGV